LEGCKLGNQGQCEFELIQKDGTHIYTNIAASSIQDDTGNYIGTLALVADITRRKKAEIALETSERKYREFADSLPEIVFESDEKGNPLFVNKMALEILGYSADEMKKANFFKFLVPEDRQRAMETVQRRIQGERTKGNEFTLLKKDGTAFPAMVFTELTQTMTGSYGLRGIIVDLSELKTATKKLIALNEKLRVVGSLTRHDVRNKLSAITGYSYILKKKHADQVDVVDGLDKMVQSVKDSMKIFDFAKVYEQLGVEELVDVNVEKAVSEAADMFSGLTFKVVNDCHGLTVRADSLLRQLIYNFIDNTRKYGQKTTTARVSTEKTSNGDLQLIYEDDGIGIPLENKTSLFKEGFSTGGSTGFGLFLSKKMIEVYGWSIQETGEPGKGAKFVITIPTR
jgi:PAS domain S-box-containing protein